MHQRRKTCGGQRRSEPPSIPQYSHLQEPCLLERRAEILIPPVRFYHKLRSRFQHPSLPTTDGRCNLASCRNLHHHPFPVHHNLCIDTVGYLIEAWTSILQDLLLLALVSTLCHLNLHPIVIGNDYLMYQYAALHNPSISSRIMLFMKKTMMWKISRTFRRLACRQWKMISVHRTYPMTPTIPLLLITSIILKMKRHITNGQHPSNHLYDAQLLTNQSSRYRVLIYTHSNLVLHN